MQRILNIAFKRLKALRDDDSGAALFITLGVFLFLYMIVAGIYAIGETIHQRMELQNATDAAAYSAAVVQADCLSRMAVVNRAMAWTYIQMTNRQMDYITSKWLDYTVKQYEKDRDACKDFYKHTLIIDCPNKPQHCDKHKNENGKGWWCGAPKDIIIKDLVCPTGVEPDAVRLNKELMSTSIDTIKSAVSRTDYNRLASAIDDDKRNIRSLNELLVNINAAMPKAMRQAAKAVFVENLTRPNALSTDNPLDDFTLELDVPTAANPYAKGHEGTSFFLPLFNTEEHERVFLAMADGSPNLKKQKHYKKLMHYFNGEDTDYPRGFDHWFIRGNKVEFDNNQDTKVIRNNTVPSPNYGITRGYKNANFTEGGKVLRGNYTTFIPVVWGAPSAQNYRRDNGNYSDLCKEAYKEMEESVSLIAEYFWASRKYWCFGVDFKLVQFCFHLPIWEWMGESDAKNCKKHGIRYDFIPEDKSFARKDYKQCYMNFNLYGISDFNNWIIMCGNARIYGDDKHIYDERYVGETCKPWILNKNFFQGKGTITATATKKLRNPLSVAFDGVRGKTKLKGIFGLYNPKENASMKAIATARAGYLRNRADSPRHYEVVYNEATHAWHPHEDQSKFGMKNYSCGQGCVCNQHKRFKEIWNLCNTDWDAVLLPTQYAVGYEAPYDTEVDENEHYWKKSNDQGWNNEPPVPETGGL